MPSVDHLTMDGHARAAEQKAEQERNERLQNGVPTMADLRARMDALLGKRS